MSSKMSKKSGKRSQASAGNHFDKLIKVCSNSKVAGSVGRFGVTSFTSIRSTAAEPKEEKKPKTKYASFKKRARLDPSASKAPVDPLPTYPPLVAPSLAGGSSSVVAPPTTILKPRKFFKSRGPMEVEVGPNNQQATKPFRPDASNLIALLPPLPNPSMSPLIPSNTNTNSQYYSLDQNQTRDHKQHKHHKKKGNKKLENLSSPPPPPLSQQQGSDSSFSSVCSPPIKLRIFKDGGQFVAQTPVATPDTPPIGQAPPGGKKRGRKPGSKSKKSETEFSFEEQKPPKKTKRSKTAAVTLPAPAARAASGRTTRNSSKRLASDSTNMGMPTLDREMRNSISSIEGLDTSGDMYPPAPATLMVDTCELQMHHQEHQQDQHQLNNSGPPAVEIIKKLEEDADFKKLSEMLSSMESENAANANSNQYSQNQHEHHQQISSQDYNNVQSYQQQQHNQGGGLDTYPVNLTSGASSSSSSQQNAPVGLSAFAAQAYMQQQFRQQIQQPPQQEQNQNQHQQNLMEHQHQDDQNYYMPPVSNSSMDVGSYRHHEQQLHHHQQMSSSSSSTTTSLPQQQHIPKANDIRSILVDDWDDFDDEQHSPRKPPSQSSQSPPKTSRFDMSAFMSGKDDSPSYPSSALETEIDQHHHQQQQQQQQQHHGGSSHVADGMSSRQIDYSSTDHIDPHQNQQQMPFNIHSSPYAMRNLLNAQGEGFTGAQGQDLSHPDHQAPLHFPTPCLEQVPLNSLSTCAKQEAISVLDSVLKQQQLTNELGNSQTSGISSVGSSTTGANSQSLSQGSQKQQVPPSTRKASIFKSRANQNANGETGGATTGASGTGKTSSKRLALYRHKFGQEEPSEEKQQNSVQPQGSVLGDFDDEFGDDDEEDLSLRKMKVENSGGYAYPWGGMSQEDEGVTKVTCKKEAKRLFTVVKNTKAVHQLQESGEFHEFDGDVQYILENLNSKNSMNIRCLSAITLATRCMEPSFRMHLRAHGTVAEFCVELRDSPQYPELALLAALVLFVLSQDRLNMDLDTDTLKLILALSKAEDVSGEQTQSQSENLETLKHHQKVLDLCVEMKNRGHATHLKLDRITASELALETLLHLTSKRAGEWVKHELRSLGGLDSIVNEVDSCLRFAQVELVQFGWTEGALERLRKIDRCLQVLQQVTFNHEHNQKYLLGQSEREIESGDGSLSRVICVEASPKIFVELFRFCKDYLQQLHMGLESAGVMREILFSVLRVLVNLSHDYRGIVLGSEILLAIDGFLQLVLHSTFEMGRFFPDEKIFDLLMHSLCMLLNLVEHSHNCRHAILSSIVQKSSAGNYRVPDSCGNTSLSNSSDDSGVDEEIPVLDAFVEMFLCRERAAKKEEQHTDNILTKGPDSRDSGNATQKEGGSNSQDKNSQEKDSEGSSLQDTIDKLIQTAGKHMENSLIAAYIALLLAYLIMDNPTAANQVRNSMPNGQYLPLMIFLKKLFNFMSITSSASGSIRGLKATAIALRFFSQADPKSDEELKKLIPD